MVSLDLIAGLSPISSWSFQQPPSLCSSVKQCALSVISPRWHQANPPKTHTDFFIIIVYFFQSLTTLSDVLTTCYVPTNRVFFLYKVYYYKIQSPSYFARLHRPDFSKLRLISYLDRLKKGIEKTNSNRILGHLDQSCLSKSIPMQIYITHSVIPFSYNHPYVIHRVICQNR